MATALERARSEAFRNSFIYVYALRYKREPYPWEIVLAQALITAELQVLRPPEATILRRVHLVTEDVALALRIPELMTVEE